MPANLATSIPAEVAESWPTPNYVDPIRQDWFPVLGGVLLTLSTLMLGTRLYLRYNLKAGVLGLDDVLLIPGWLFATAFTAVAMLATQRYGINRHTWDVQPQLFEYAVLAAWICELLYFLSTCCIKISVLLFLRRVASHSLDTKWRVAIVGGIAFTVAYGIVFIFVLIFNCSPTEAYWKSYSLYYDKNFTCHNTQVLNWVTGVIAIVTDLYAVILPCLKLRNVNASNRQKIAFNALFCMGLLTCASGVARTYYIQSLPYHYDFTWYSFRVFVTTEIEMMLGIICASAPSVRVVFREYLNPSLGRAVSSARVAALDTFGSGRGRHCGVCVDAEEGEGWHTRRETYLSLSSEKDKRGCGTIVQVTEEPEKPQESYEMGWRRPQWSMSRQGVWLRDSV